MPPAVLWEALSRTDRYQQWWGWLRGFEGGALEEGRTTGCIVRAPLPYALHFAVTVERVVAAERVEARVSGDLEGPAVLEMGSHLDGSWAGLHWEMELRAPLLRAASVLGRPVMVWGHDWVVGTGVEQFRAKALGPDWTGGDG